MTQRRVDVGSSLAFEGIHQGRLEDEAAKGWRSLLAGVQDTLLKSEQQRNHAVPWHSLLAYKRTSKKANRWCLWRYMEV